jgi:hypothetical protein
MEGGLWAWEALQCAFKVSAKDANVLKVQAWVKRREISSNKRGNFIVCDGQIHSWLSHCA